jgi:hypothetical protein
MLLNVSARVVFVINAIIHAGSWINPSGTASGIARSAVGVSLTIGAGFYGWTMIQTDHVGVELTLSRNRLAVEHCRDHSC